MKITDLSILCKLENLKNRQCIKYLFAPLYIYIYLSKSDIHYHAISYLTIVFVYLFFS